MVTRIANRVVTRRAPRLSVRHASRADRAKNLAAPEAFHEVNAAGEPPFQNGWINIGGPGEQAGFFKDREGVVHLMGEVNGGAVGSVIFQLPPGYRPAAGSVADFAVACNCSTIDPQGGSVSLTTGSVSVVGNDGRVYLYNADAADHVFLDGITFRAR